MASLTDLSPTIRDAVGNAEAMAWDGCHKVYLLMDQGAVDDFVATGYSVAVPDLVLAQDWWDRSCRLRFVQAVFTRDDPDDGFVTVIGQGADEEV